MSPIHLKSVPELEVIDTRLMRSLLGQFVQSHPKPHLPNQTRKHQKAVPSFIPRKVEAVRSVCVFVYILCVCCLYVCGVWNVLYVYGMCVYVCFVYGVLYVFGVCVICVCYMYVVCVCVCKTCHVSI